MPPRRFQSTTGSQLNRFLVNEFRKVFFMFKMSTNRLSASKKRIAFYPILSPGHTNVSVSLAKLLLDKYSAKLDVFFIVDFTVEAKLAAIDGRFKFSSFDLKDHAQGLVKLVDDLEKCLTMSLEDKLKFQWRMFTENPTLIETDRLAEKAIQAIKPDFSRFFRSSNLEF